MSPVRRPTRGQRRSKRAPRPRNAGEAGQAHIDVKKILVFMSTTSRNLIDRARDAQARVRAALQAARNADKETGGHFAARRREVEVHVLVHGFQTEGATEMGSMEINLTVCREGHIADGVEPSAPTFIPGDSSVVGKWASEKLAVREGRTIDSTMLVFWGHGLGVATTLTLPTHLPADPSPVRGPGLANIGGLHDHDLIQSLTDHKIDLLVFDSCLMAGVELACEYSSLARYLVASQTLVETAPGGPPGLNLGQVVATFVGESAWCADAEERDRTLREAAASMADLVGETQSGAQQLTVFDLSRCLVSPESTEREIRAAHTWLSQIQAQPPGPRPDIVNAVTHLHALVRAHNGAPAPLGVVGLLWLFTNLLTQASTQPTECERIKLAFRGTVFGRARQLLDLRDLAFQVHQVCQEPRLQMAALALFNELTSKRDGFVVAHRATLTMEEKLRVGGVSIYCPWFTVPAERVEGPFNVTIESGRYHALAMPSMTDWAAFVYGPMFEATAADRRWTPAPATHEADGFATVLARLIRELSGCTCGEEGGSERDRAWSGSLGKPSRGSLGKPSGGSLGKPSGGSLGFVPAG